MPHTYTLHCTWTGANESGTTTYTSYSRAHTLAIEGKPTLHASADRAFRGDASAWNPEDLLLASITACHMLWYLHLCADAGVVVVGYEDRPEATMRLDPGNGRFVEAVLRPHVTITAASDPNHAAALHADAHAECFIANSVNFPVRCEPVIVRLGG